MGDEIPFTGDDIGIPGLAHFDLRDDFPDVFEVDFGDQDTDHLSGERLDGDGNTHVGLGLPHEIHRTEERGTSTSLRESLVRGTVS